MVLGKYMVSLSITDVKQILYDMGADLCKIASVDRFNEAPKGFHPIDVLPSCKSVIVFAKKMPVGVLQCNSTIPYTVTRNTLSQELDSMSVRFCGVMEQYGIVAVPIGTLGPSRLDPETGRWRSAVSIKHCAELAGLGRIGKNTLLVTPEYGNMVWLNAIISDAILEADEMLPDNPCISNCTLCIDSCPVNALEQKEMKQEVCHAYAFKEKDNEDWTFSCYTCRTICPNCYGTKNSLR